MKNNKKSIIIILQIYKKEITICQNSIREAISPRGGGVSKLSTPLAIEAEIQRLGSAEGKRVSNLPSASLCDNCDKPPLTREGDRASGRIEVEKVESSEDRRVGWLQEQATPLCHSEPYNCQAEDETLKVSGEESLCTFTEILRVKNDCHPQNDVMANENQTCSNSLAEIKHTPSTYGRGLEFQHEGRVLEIQGEGANNNQRLLSLSKLVKILLTYLPTNLHTPVKNLVPYYPSALVPSRKAAFTLAEVLITLGIIGIVAAMTLPAVVNRTQQKKLETGLHKAYSVISAAYNQMGYDEGQIINSANYNQQSFMKVFKKYFKVSKDCGDFGCESGETPEEGGYKISQNYRTYNNSSATTNLFDDGQVLISDGMLIMVENNTGPLHLTVDVNGYNKKPNRWGHDLFTFQIMDNGKLLPMGAQGTLYRNDATYCSNTSTSNYNGIGCTYRALTEKDYFKNLP